MRLTLVLCKYPRHKWLEVRQLKDQWKRRGNYIVRLDPIPPALQGKELVEAVDLVTPKSKNTWVPPPDDFRFLQPPKPIEEMPDYHPEPVLEMSQNVRLSEGLKQACILTKSQHIKGFPPAVKAQIGKISTPDQDELVQRAIMRSQLWNNVHTKLPKRKDFENLGFVFCREFGVPRTKQGDLIITDLVMLAQKIGVQRSQAALNRRLVNLPSLQTHFNYRDKTILVNNIGHSVIMGKEALPPFGYGDLVEASTSEALPDMFPIFPTIDLNTTNNYVVRSEAVWKEPTNFSEGVPHTLYLNNRTFWSDDQKQAAALMICLGYTATVARAKYGADVKRLPEPVMIQNVNMNWNTANYLFFQLNTLDFSADDGVKNLVWTDSGNVLFDKQLPQPWKGKELEFNEVKYHSYNPKFFEKFFAVHLHGLNDIHIHE